MFGLREGEADDDDAAEEIEDVEDVEDDEDELANEEAPGCCCNCWCCIC